MISKIISTNPAIMCDEIQKLKDGSIKLFDTDDAIRYLGAKNLNSYPYNETTKEAYGITWTDLGDGTVKANGTATANTNFSLHLRGSDTKNTLVLPNGKYRITGCPEGGSATKYRIQLYYTKSGAASLIGYDYGNGFEFVLNGDDDHTDAVRLQVQLQVLNGTRVDNIIFKPMIELLSIADPDVFVSFSETNKQLTDDVNALKCSETTAGSYYLTATVDSSGNITYSWEVIE